MYADAGAVARGTGLIRGSGPEGPSFVGRRVEMARIGRGTLVALLNRRDRALVAALTLGWAVATGWFWLWLLRPEHRVGGPGLAINVVVLAYLSLTPGYFLLAANRLRGVAEDLPIPALRTALVTTKAPGEPWPVARKTLESMLAQDHPHPYDVWLCDEDPSEETIAWCTANGIWVSTRRHISAYHQAAWPRRTRCKEGNLAYFYDNWGYRDYDVVVQLDCDHVPEPTYLSEMLRPFSDPGIGYVAAPSVCDSNAADSWAARGRLYAEASFHGPMQTGLHGLAPACIGSHYAVRTAALAQVGGLGPELAEDFSTSFLLTSAGWQGAFAHRAHAHGEGPPTVTAMATQEFQWSRSLVTILLSLAPRHLARMPWRLRARFGFALTYYPLFALLTGVGMLLPPVAALTGVRWLAVNYADFLLRWLVAAGFLLAIHLLLGRRGLLRPRNAPVLSWELWLYMLAKWPYIAQGVVAAVRQRIRPRPIGFAVTPKARGGLDVLPLRLITPYLVISAGMSGAALGGELTTDAAGYVALCLLAAAGYAVVALAVPLLHAREAGRAADVGWWRAVRRTATAPALLAVAGLFPLGTAIGLYPGYALRVFGW
jgi:cellulose synthase/poly-beta-1,6-N-acetylglucosamine synthase-like glycosyltransferase